MTILSRMKKLYNEILFHLFCPRLQKNNFVMVSIKTPGSDSFNSDQWTSGNTKGKKKSDITFDIDLF